VNPGWVIQVKSKTSNEDFPPSKFKAHGRITVFPEGSIVYLDLTGPFNQEFFASLRVLNEELYTSLKRDGNFAEIATFRSSMLMPQDAIEEFGSILAHRKNRNTEPLATAWVIADDVTDSRLMLPLLERKFSAAERPFQAFDTLQDAEFFVRRFL
jgi:hypothetical protein